MTPRQIITHYGGNPNAVAAAAERIGVTRQCVYNWRKTGRVSAQWQSWAEKDTKGRLRADGKKPARN
jgi:hypothetical protein